MLVVVLETGVQTHGSSRLAPVHASPGGQDPKQAGTRPPQASSVVVVPVVLLVDVVVGAVVELVLVGHGSGVQEPGPTSMPPSSVHEAADSVTQTNAPAGEPGMQHWVIPGALVEVVLVVGVLVVELLAEHGSGTQEPGPTSVPPSSAQSAGDSGMQKAPPSELGMQHCVTAGRLVVVVLVVVLGAPPIVVVVGAGDDVVDVVDVEPGAIVVLLEVPHGVEPATPTRLVMQSTKAPSAESIAAASPVV